VAAKDPYEKGKGHEVLVEDGEVVTGENFPLVFDGGTTTTLGENITSGNKRTRSDMLQQVFDVIGRHRALAYLLLCAVPGLVEPGLAETPVASTPYQVVLLPYEHDHLPRHAYLRRESPVIRVRFINQHKQASEARGQVSLMLAGRVLTSRAYAVKIPAKGVAGYSVKIPLHDYRVAAYQLTTQGTVTGLETKSYMRTETLWICPEPERGGMVFALLDDQQREGPALDEHLQKLRAMGMTGVMNYYATVPLLERSLWYGLNCMSVSHSDARSAGFNEPAESLSRLNASGQPFLNYGSTDKRGRWGIADPDWQDATARSLEKNVAALVPYPAYDPRICTSDDYFMWTGLDYNPWNVKRFKELHGIEPPRPPEALATDFPASVQRPKGIIPDNEPWVLWMRFLSRDVLGRYNRGLTQAVLRATDNRGKIGPLPGGGPPGHKGPIGLVPLVDLASGQWPPYNFGDNGFNLTSYYNYNSYYFPALAQVWWAALGRLGNRNTEQWLMPDTWDANPSYHLHNWHLFMASGLQGLVYFIHGQISPGSDAALKKLGPITRRYRHLLSALRPVSRKVGLLMPFENSCFRSTYPAAASYAFGNLAMAHAEVEPVWPEELPARMTQYRVIVLHDIDWLTESNRKILQDYIAKGGRVLCDSLTEVELPRAVRLDFSLGQADRARGYGDLQQIAKVKNVIESYIQPWAQSDNPRLLLRHFQAGGVDYLWVVHLMSHEQDAARIPDPGHTAETAPPPDPPELEQQKFRGNISVPLGNFAVYDVLAGRPVTGIRDGQRLRLPVSTALWQGALLAFYPRAPQSLRIEAPARANGAMASIKVSVLSGKKPVAAVLPLEITVVDPDGAVNLEYSRAALTTQGTYTFRLPLAANDLSGTWQVKVRELSSGLEQSVSIKVVGLRRKSD